MKKLLLSFLLITGACFGQTQKKWSDLPVETTIASGDWLMMLDATGPSNKRAPLSNLKSFFQNQPTVGDYLVIDDSTNTVRLALSGDRIFHDTDNDGTKDAGEEFIDGSGGSSDPTPEALPANGTLVTNSHYYEDTLAATDTWTLPASPTEGDEITVDVVNAAETVITFSTTLPYRVGGSSTISTITLPAGNHRVFCEYSNSKWRMADSGVDDEGGIYLADSGGASPPAFDATSAGLLGALNDETGTGVVVFGTSPTITTPVLSGVAALADSSAVGAEGNADALADDTYQAFKVITGRNAGEVITQWDLVYLNPTDGEWHQADADESTAAGKAWGIAVAAGTDGNPLTVMVSGIIRNDGWAWSDEGVDLFVSDTAGGLTATAPSTTGDVVKIVARTLSDDEIYVDVTHHFLVAD